MRLHVCRHHMEVRVPHQALAVVMGRLSQASTSRVAATAREECTLLLSEGDEVRPAVLLPVGLSQVFDMLLHLPCYQGQARDRSGRASKVPVLNQVGIQ